MPDQPPEVEPRRSGPTAPPPRGDGPEPETGRTRLPAFRRSTGPRPARNRHARARLLRRLMLVLLLLLIVGGLVWAVLPGAIPVDTTAVRRGPLQVVVREDGFTRVRDRYDVSAPQAGHLQRVTLRAGDRVEEGDVVARLAPLAPQILDVRTRAEAEARVAAAEAGVQRARAAVNLAATELRQARAEARRLQRLADQNAVATADVEQAWFAVRAREAALAEARAAEEVAENQQRVARAALERFDAPPAENGWMEIPAPVTGEVLRVHRESAGAVQAGEPLLELGDPRRLEVVIDVLTTEAVEIAPGAPAILQRWGGDRVLEGRVRHVEPGAFTALSPLGVEEQRVNVIVDFVAPPDELPNLGDRFRVEAGIVVWEADDVVKAPAGGVFRDVSGWAAFVVDDGRARLRSVEVGRRGEVEVEIRDGLAPGEAVLVYPPDSVVDGTRITAR